MSFKRGAMCLLVLLAGCTATSKAWQVLRDPSLPVGLPQDQPSTLALSIVASPALNVATEAAFEPVDTGAQSPGYHVRLTSGDLAGLLGQLKITTQQLQHELDEAGASLAETSVATAADVQLESIDVLNGARAVGDYPAAVEDVGNDGQHDLPLAGGTPVRVSVLQLKDDGVFLSLDAEALWASPEKSLGKTYLDHDELVIRPDSYKFVPFYPVRPGTRFIAIAVSYQDNGRGVWRAVHRIDPRGRSYPLLVTLGESSISIKTEDSE